ncbi:hypothetical protein [Chryseobacterium oryzae]|uniref:Lipoprotein n=1 Tax=Chryseobacterium oryzae TaxID=2929799 RepID=A0ABY4BRE1_9FLAO|nr:hypothetical protein [Chryseobacterium oryzae]UOE39145.1 hypothetical protein MTP08_05090 [Chryseobacterium oryzae]
MSKLVTFLVFICILSSCKTHQTEFLEFESSNAVIIGENKTNITLVPRNKKVIVKIFRKNEYFDNKKISKEKYQQILSIYNQIFEKDSSKSLWLDPPILKIKYQKDNFKKDFYYIGVPKKDEKFHELLNMILKSAKLEIRDI